MWRKNRDRLDRIERALHELQAALAKHGDALNLSTPGGLAVVGSELDLATGPQPALPDPAPEPPVAAPAVKQASGMGSRTPAKPRTRL